MIAITPPMKLTDSAASMRNVDRASKNSAHSDGFQFFIAVPLESAVWLGLLGMSPWRCKWEACTQACPNWLGLGMGSESDHYNQPTTKQSTDISLFLLLQLRELFLYFGFGFLDVYPHSKRDRHSNQNDGENDAA